MLPSDALAITDLDQKAQPTLRRNYFTHVVGECSLLNSTMEGLIVDIEIKTI
jgi:hypothetical protein